MSSRLARSSLRCCVVEGGNTAVVSGMIGGVPTALRRTKGRNKAELEGADVGATEGPKAKRGSGTRGERQEQYCSCHQGVHDFAHD